MCMLHLHVNIYCMLLQVDFGKQLESSKSESQNDENEAEENTINVEIDTSSNNINIENIDKFQQDVDCLWFYSLLVHQRKYPVCPISHQMIEFIDTDKSIEYISSHVLRDKHVNTKDIDNFSELLYIFGKCDASSLKFQSEHRVCTAVEYFIRAFENEENPNVKQNLEPGREVNHPFCMADQSFEYMNVMQTVGLCFDSDISAKKSVNPQTQTRPKDINNVDCMKIDYQDIMQIYLFHSTCSYYGKDIDSEPSCLEPVQINKVFTEDSIDIDDKQRTEKDNKLKASEGIIKVSPNAAAKVEFLSLLLMSWYPHLEITPANGVEAKKTPPIDHTKTEKHPPRNDTSMELDDLAGKPEIPDSQTDLGEPKIGKEYMWLTCPNEQLLELEFSKLFMCTIDGMESTSTVSEVVKNLEKESNHVIQDEGLLSDSSQIAIMQNNNGTTPWSTLSANKCQGSECPENKAERRSVFHDKPRMSQTQSQYCSRPMYVDLLVPSGGLCEVQQKTSKQEVFYRSTALSCSKLKRYKDILLAYNQPKFCIIQDFSIAPKVPTEAMSVNTSSRLDGYHHEFADAYMKKYYCFGSQSILPPEVDHHEDKSGSINTILVSKKLTLRWNQSTCSKIDGYFHTLNDNFRKEKQCLIDGDQVDVKSKEKSQKVCSKHSQSCLYVDLFMKIISFYKRICFMTDGHMLMHREFESILIEANLDSKPSIKTFKQPNETIEHKILHGHGSCRLDLFEDIVTFRSKQRFSRNGIIKEIEMCPLRKITLMEEVGVPSEATDESILHSEKHEQNVPVDLTGSTPEIRFSYSHNDSCFQGSKLDDYKALLSFMCTPLQFQSGQDKQLPEKEGNYFVEIETILCPINTCCPFSKVDGYKALFNLMCIPLYLKSAENSSEGKILKESEVHQSYTNPLLHCSKIDEYKTLFILMTDTPVQLQLSSDSHFPTNLGISLDVTRSALSSISCCQCPKMDEYKTLFEIKKHAPPDFQLTQATAFPPKERKDLIELKVSHSLPLQSDSDEQFPNDKGKGLEEIVVSYSPSNSYCLCSKIDEYKALFTLKTCVPLHSQSSSDEQLPTDRGKGLEEIEVFHSHRNSCRPYSKMDKYKALFEIMKHTPHDFQSTQSITFPLKEGKDLIELKVSRSPIKPCQYSKVDGYKALFNLAACDPLPLQWDSDEQFLNDKGKGLEEIVVSNSPTNSYCLSSKMDEYKAMFKLTVCDSLHLQPTPVAQSSTDKGKGFKVIGVFRSHNASCCQCYKLDEYKTLFDHTICSSAHIQSAKDSQYLTIKGKGSEEIEVSQSSTKSCSHLSKIDEYEAMFYPATCSSVPLQLAEGSQYLKVKENASEETEVSESPTKSCHHCSNMEEYKELFHPTTCSSADMQLGKGLQYLTIKGNGSEEMEVFISFYQLLNNHFCLCNHSGNLTKWTSSCQTDLFMLLVFSVSHCIPDVFPSDLQPCSKLESTHEHFSKQNNQSKSKSSEYEIYLYKVILKKEDVCLQVEFQNHSCTALDLLNHDDLQTEKGNVHFEYEIYRLLMESEKLCSVKQFDDSCSLLEGFDRVSREESHDLLRPDGGYYDLLIYRSVMMQEDVCLPDKCFDKRSTALYYVKTSDSKSIKELDRTDYELYRYFMSAKKWCIVEQFIDSQSCSVFEIFDGQTSVVNSRVLKPYDLLIYKAILNQENVCLAVKNPHQYCTILDVFDMCDSQIPDGSKYDLYRNLMVASQFCFIEESMTDMCPLIQYLDIKSIPEVDMISIKPTTHDDIGGILYYQLMTNIDWCIKDENFFTERYCLPEDHFSNTSGMQEREALIFNKRASGSLLFQLLMTCNGMSFQEDHSTAGCTCDIVSYFCSGSKDDEKKDVRETGFQRRPSNLALYFSLLTGSRFCLADDEKLHTSSKISLIFDHFIQDNKEPNQPESCEDGTYHGILDLYKDLMMGQQMCFVNIDEHSCVAIHQFVGNVTETAASGAFKSSSDPKQYVTFCALAQGFPISFPNDKQSFSYCTWFDFNLSSNLASALSGKSATQNDTTLVISNYEEMIMSPWKCMVYVDKMANCMCHDAHPHDKYLEKKSQLNEKSYSASKPKRNKKKRQRQRSDIKFENNLVKLKSMIDSFSQCRLLHESDYRSVCFFFSHRVSQIMENSVVYTSPLIDTTRKRRSVYSLQVDYVSSDEGKEPEGTGNSEEHVDDDDTQKENEEEIEEKTQDSETSQKNEEEDVIGEAVETDEVEDSERKHDIEEDIVKQNDEIQPDSIQPSPSFEVIDGTTIYLNDLEPTPLPGEPASEKYNTFNIHSSDIVDVPKKEDSDESDVGPPSSFSFKSEDEIDPEAYRNILNKLHANPELRDKEGAIQQEMLKILRDPELKKNLLIKAHEPKRDILSPFRSQHPAPGDAVHMDQAQGHVDDNVDLQKLDAMQDESVPLDDSDTAIPPLATGPNVVKGRPSSPLDKDEEDINFVDPLALLQEDTEEPPLSINEKIDIAEEILKTKDFSSENLQPPVPPDDPYDPVKLAAKLNTVKGSNPAVFGDPAQEVFNDDPALSALEDQNDPVEQESQEPSLNHSHVTMPSDTEQVEDKVETIDDEEVPSPHLDSHLPPGVDTRPNVEELADSSYGEPGLRTSTRVDEEETPEDTEHVDHDHPLDEENAEDLEHSNPFDGDDVEERPEDAQERPDDVQEIPDDVVLDTGVQDEDNSHEGEGFHHQIYTREENGELQDDGVTIEEVPEHQEEQNGTGPGGDWFGEMLRNLEPAIEELNRSILKPMFEMLPIEFQRAIQQPHFLGIPWMFIIIFDASMFTFFMLIFCFWVCSSRRSRIIQERLSREVDVLIAQKAEVMDALDMTNTQFQKQNLEYFELKTSTERTGSDKSKLETKYKEITHTSKEQQKEIEQIKATIKKKTSEHESSQQKIKSLEQQVKKSQKTISDLNGQVNDLQGKVYAGEEECSHLEHNIGTLEEQKQQLDTSKEMLEDEIKGWNERVSELSEQIKLITTEKKDMEESLTYKDNEIEVLKDCLLQLKGLEHIQKEGPEVDSESRIQQLMDVTRVNAKLSLIQKERDEIQQKLDDEVKCGRDLESKVGMLHHEIDALRMEHSKAQSNLGETKTKMEVLQEYFKGKEVELQRKLGREEALKLQSEEQLTSLSEKAINAEVDLNNYRQQIADLKSELEKSERNYKTQIAAHEKKTHEHWLSSRTAERELQEAKREAASLRHRLTELEGRRATSENAPLVKPQAAAPSPMRVVSPSYGPGDRGSKMSRRGPSRNSMIEADAPSPPLIDPRHRGSPGSRPRMSPPMMDRDMPPPHPDDYLPPPMHRDMGPSPYREVLPHHPDFGPPGPGPYNDSYGPPPPHGPPPHGGFSPEFGPHPDDMDFGPHGPPPGDFGPPMRFPPPGRGEFDLHGPPPPMPMGPDFDPMFGPPPPHGMDPMHGPGPFPRNGPPPFDRRGPPPAMRPSSRSGPGGAPDGPMGGPRTSSPMVTPDGQRGPRGPPPRQPSNMQA
ncbi:uncharacterized protein LOC129264571 isoform X2 [Lytechinus pictus]|uniref:uncharacterized protein LOC129264571 isoform X2 n=1 Tax=Lytechinus pictus TaxID=7653 RepID=UPI0030BA27CA